MQKRFEIITSVERNTINIIIRNRKGLDCKQNTQKKKNTHLKKINIHKFWSQLLRLRLRDR